jgi:predicted kinase
VILDATFRTEKTRRDALEVARRCGVPALMLLYEADLDVVRTRLATLHDDASDADRAVYEQLAASWEKPGPLTRHAIRVVNTTVSPEEALVHALKHLREARLAGED